jgi:hypothetical protein
MAIDIPRGSMWRGALLGKTREERAVKTRLRRGVSMALGMMGVGAALLGTATGAFATTPKVLQYQDREGVGQITLTEFAPDPATGGVRLHVRLAQRGRVYSGTGFQVLLYQDPPNQSDRATVYLVTFTLRDPFGRPFLFRGRLQTGGIAGRLLGSGRYEQAGVGNDLDQWTISDR